MSLLHQFNRVIGPLIPDALYLELLYYKNFHCFPDLKKPKKYTEKCQWLKLNYRLPEYSMMADKGTVKDFICNRIGSGYTVNTYGIYDSFEEIKFDDLPLRFVMKCTHDSGGIRICMDKDKFDYNEARRFFRKRLKHNYFYDSREYPYKNIKPRIIIEEYIENKTVGELRDYKFLTFNGVPKVMYIATSRFSDSDTVKFDFYDMEFRHLNLYHKGINNSPKEVEKPKNFEKMIEISHILSEGTPTLRVDFYETEERLYVGELTFYQEGGMIPFNSDEWDKKLGSFITIV